MIDDSGFSLTPTTILAQAASILTAASYRLEREVEKLLDLPAERAFIAEDKYGVVVVAVYDTWGDLASGWRTAQTQSVEVLSDRFTRLDRKAWDGYLVLLTPALAAEADATVHEIRYDTSRIRKIVATGDDLRSLDDVEHALLPLLPLAHDTVEVDEGASPLDELPDRLESAGVLEEKGIGRELVEAAVEAFKTHRPIVQEIQHHLTSE